MVTRLTLAACSYMLLALHIAGGHGTWEVVECCVGVCEGWVLCWEWVGYVHVQFCGVRGWQNGVRCRDGMKVLWCCCYLGWSVFEGSIPTSTCFQSENVYFCFFL